jgi:hypothetical protein
MLPEGRWIANISARCSPEAVTVESVLYCRAELNADLLADREPLLDSYGLI